MYLGGQMPFWAENGCCSDCRVDLKPNEASFGQCMECQRRSRTDEPVLGLRNAPPLEIPEWGTIHTKQHPDSVRLDYLDKHSTIQISRKGKIKITIHAEPNGVNTELLRNYIDHLMEQGAK